MEIAYADSQTTMQVLSADDFPRIDLDITENSFALNTSDLKDFIRSTTFCCASDDSRPILKGCQFVINGDEICVTSLDGFRLGTVKGKVMSSTGNMYIEQNKAVFVVSDQNCRSFDTGFKLVLFNGNFSNEVSSGGYDNPVFQQPYPAVYMPE